MIFALVIGALAAILSEGAGSPRIVDPANHRSESGVYFVQVEPTERTGAGASRVRFWKERKVAWSNEVPFTFTHAHVGDDGTLCGVAAGNGSRPGAGGDLVFAVIDPAGAITRTIARLPDGRWFREIMGVAIALDRTILVTADRSLAFFARDPSANQLLDLSGANVGRAWPLDAGDWVVLWSDAGASLLRKADNPLYRARLHGSEGEGRRAFGVPADR